MSVRSEIASVYREAWGIYRSHPVALLAVGTVAFLVFGVPPALLHETQTGKPGEVLLILAVQLEGFVGSFLYYGYCEKIAAQARRGRDVSIRRALRDTYHILLALIAASVVADVLITLGLLALVLPGVYLAVRYAVVPPASSFEHLWPRAALKRSRGLVRGRFWLVFFTAFAMFACEQLASSLGDALGAHISADETIGRVLGDAAGDLLVGPFAGVVVATVYFRLKAESAAEAAGRDRQERAPA